MPDRHRVGLGRLQAQVRVLLTPPSPQALQRFGVLRAGSAGGGTVTKLTWIPATWSACAAPSFAAIAPPQSPPCTA
jgi:hypothetical protein